MKFKNYISQYQVAYRKYYEREISQQEALAGVIRLFNLAKAVYEPIPKEVENQNEKK